MKDNISDTISFDDFRYSREFFNLKISKRYYILVFILCGFVILSFLWMFIFDYDVVIKASATIRPRIDVSQIKTGNSGIISVKNYHNGQKVEKGDMLFSLDTTVLLSEIENTRLLQERSNDGREVLSELKRLISQGFIEENHKKDEAFIRASVYFSEKEMKQFVFDKAENDYQSELQIPEGMTYRQKILELKNARDIALSDLNNYMAEFQYSILQEERTLQKTCESLQIQLYEYEQNLALSKISAPISGIIEELEKVNIGDFVSAGEAILRIVPDDKRIMALLSVDARSIADIKLGQQVKIKLAALPSAEYGQAIGFITRIGADSFSYSDGKSYYQVDVSIEDNFLTSRSHGRNELRPGMTGTARIITKQQKLFMYILEKLW